MALSKKNMKLEILRMLDTKCKAAYRTFLEKKAECEASIAGSRQWEREHPDDGVGCFSMNKFNPDAATASKQAAESDYQKWQQICDYALNTLVE